jgi:hypothetical protein
MSDPRILKRGMTGLDVAEWQPIVGARADGVFGEETETLTKMWQSRQGLRADGIVGPLTRAAAMAASTVPPPAPPTVFDPTPAAFIAARYFNRSRYGSDIRNVVIHTAETGEVKKSARGTANWFNSEMRAKDGNIYEASAHFCVDADEIIGCVDPTYMAYGAPGANRQGIHIEHAGRASQTPEQWADEYSDRMLRRSAALVSALCRKHGIPIKRIGPDELKAGGRGICGHDTVSAAFPVRGAHTDPGPAFPWARYIDLVMTADGMGDVKPDATA